MFSLSPLCLIFVLIYLSVAHIRLVDPPPRSLDSGIKFGPCGSETGNFSANATTIDPGPFNITWEETFHHYGTPYRISLSREGIDEYNCVLLDHIPQHTGSSIKTMSITVNIPNISCNPCAIQIISFMTNQINSGECCEYRSPGTSFSDNGCGSNYHSCGNVIINGTEDRDNLTCSEPSGWPYRDFTPNLYGQLSSSLWSGSPNLTLPTTGNLKIQSCQSPESVKVKDEDLTVIVSLLVGLSVILSILVGVAAVLFMKKRKKFLVDHFSLEEVDAFSNQDESREKEKEKDSQLHRFAI